MSKIISVLLLSVLMVGCGSLNSGQAPQGNTAAAETKPAVKFNVGDTVVAKWAQTSFYEGKVENVTDAKVKVKWLDGSSPTEVDISDVFTLPKAGVKPDAKAGDIVLAKTGTGSYWNGVEISSVDGDVYSVKSDSGQTTNVAAEKIITIPAAVAANFKQKASANDFTKEAHEKKPVIPAGFKAKEGDQVLAQWSKNSWWQGKVQKISGTKATVAWEDGSKPSEAELQSVLPMPGKDGPMPKENQFVLAKPESGTKWVYARVSAVTGNKIEVKLADGKSRSLAANEFVILN